MELYPVNLDLADKPCAVIGGGKVARRKVDGLLRAGARVTVISPEIVSAIAALAEIKKIFYWPRSYEPGDLRGFFLVICAANRQEVNLKAAVEAKQCGALVNVVDGSDRSDFFVPAQVRRGDLLLTVSTGGRSPALAGQVRRSLEATYGEEYGVFLDMVAALRDELKTDLPESADRVRFWQNAFNQDILNLIKRGKLKKAEAELRNAIGSFGTQS